MDNSFFIRCNSIAAFITLWLLVPGYSLQSPATTTAPALFSWRLLIYILVILLLFTFFFIIRRIEIKRLSLKNELELERIEKTKLTEIDQLKSRFFENLSHEFRTMLMLITGPLESLQKSINAEVYKQNIALRTFEVTQYRMRRELNRKHLQIMQNNAQLLGRLVNQLLDLAKLEAGQLALRTRPIEIISVLRNLVLSFSPYAENKKIDLHFETEHDALFAFVDLDKFEVIMNNLLSNATKYTPEGGDVSVLAQRRNAHLLMNNHYLDCIEIKISDTGAGIPPDQMDKIFQRFYRVTKNGATSTCGAGIGLALTRDLVELHYGKIMVTSTENEGTSFTICLPIGKTHLKESEIAAEFIQVSIPPENSEIPLEMPAKTKHETEKLKILIVEDNIEMRFYLHSVLRREYHVEEATNGKEALDFILSNNPDVIVSDIMMPVMDGIDLCKAIKTDVRFNHIPVILLTARAAETDRIRGLNIGANDYIVKPFQNDVLRARIHNILDDRQKMRERIQKELLMQPELHEEMSEDERLIHRAKDIVQHHLDDFEFTIEDFAAAMAISRSYLNRKIQAIVGMSASRFIREIRLTTAAHLIESHKGNVTEIALEVGFDNFAYFTRCFKEKYGRPPSKYTGQKNSITKGRES